MREANHNGGVSCSVVETIFSQRSFLMGIAMLCIMMFHQYFISHRLLYPFRMLGFYGVDVFFFLSGMGIASSLQRSTVLPFFKKRFVRLLPAWLIVITLSYFIGEPSEAWSVSGYILWFFHLWFLNTLLIYYLLSPILIRLLSRTGGAGVAGIFVLLVAYMYLRSRYAVEPWKIELPPFLVRPVDWSIWRFPVYVLGVYFVVCRQSTEKEGLWCVALPLLLLPIVCVLGTGVLKPFIKLDWLMQVYGYASMYQLTILSCAIPGICFWGARLGQVIAHRALHRAISVFGVLSLELYLWHEWIYAKLCKIGNISYIGIWLSDWEWMLGIVFLLIAIVCSLLLAWATNKVVSCAMMMLKGRVKIISQR